MIESKDTYKILLGEERDKIFEVYKQACKIGRRVSKEVLSKQSYIYDKLYIYENTSTNLIYMCLANRSCGNHERAIRIMLQQKNNLLKLYLAHLMEDMNENGFHTSFY